MGKDAGKVAGRSKESFEPRADGMLNCSGPADCRDIVLPFAGCQRDNVPLGSESEAG